MTLALREATSRDRSFVASRWVRSYSAARADVSKATYEQRWNDLVDLLLPRCRVTIACSANEPSALWGFAVTEGDVVHYVYVMREFWRAGVARALITEALGSYPESVRCTHRWPFRGERFRFDWFPLTGAERLTDHEQSPSE